MTMIYQFVNTSCMQAQCMSHRRPFSWLHNRALITRQW